MPCSHVWVWLCLVHGLVLQPAVRVRAVLPKVMHQLHRPSPWSGEDRHSLDLKAWLLWGSENPFSGVDRGEGRCLPCQGLCGLACATPQLLH